MKDFVMLVSNYSKEEVDRIISDAGFVYVQEKYDGARCLIKDGSIYTRSGNKLLVPTESALGYFICHLDRNLILDGELLVIDNDGRVLPRKTGNGIINKAQHGNITLDESNRLVFVAFDLITLGSESSDNYTSRLDKLRLLDIPVVLFGEPTPPVCIASTCCTTSTDSIDSILKGYLSEGKEGVVVKSPNNIWKPKRVKDIMRLKAVLTADLRVVAHEEGTGKYTGMLGALVCQTDDGQLVVRVGTGFTDKDRRFDNAPKVGSIVEVKYNAVITKDGSNTKSLFLPVFVGCRNDKTTTNTTDELIK